MNINGFNINSLPQPSAAGRISGEVATSDDFGSVVTSALDSLNASQIGAEQEVAKAVSGESQDLHKTIIAIQSADLQFQLGLQVRNKLIGAYEEIMRMQV
jgi:flagellar hook-basal body complex protein FliE